MDITFNFRFHPPNCVQCPSYCMVGYMTRSRPVYHMFRLVHQLFIILESFSINLSGKTSSNQTWKCKSVVLPLLKSGWKCKRFVRSSTTSLIFTISLLADQDILHQVVLFRWKAHLFIYSSGKSQNCRSKKNGEMALEGHASTMFS